MMISITSQQKITPQKYPYKFEIIAEREYLMPIAVDTGESMDRFEKQLCASGGSVYAQALLCPSDDPAGSKLYL